MYMHGTNRLGSFHRPISLEMSREILGIKGKSLNVANIQHKRCGRDYFKVAVVQKEDLIN